MFLQWPKTLFLQALFLKGFGGDLAKCYAQASMVATDAVSNIRTVAAFGAEEKVLDLFVAELEEPKKRTQSRSQIAGFFYGLSQFFIFSSYGLTMYYASVLIKKRVIFGIDGFAHLVKCVIIVMFSAILLAETLTSASDVMNCGQVKAPDPFFKRVILTIVVGSYDWVNEPWWIC